MEHLACKAAAPERQLQSPQAGRGSQVPPFPTVPAAKRFFCATHFLCGRKRNPSHVSSISTVTSQDDHPLVLYVGMHACWLSRFEIKCIPTRIQVSYQVELRQGVQRLQCRQQVGSQWQLCPELPQVGQCPHAGLRVCWQPLQSSHNNRIADIGRQA